MPPRKVTKGAAKKKAGGKPKGKPAAKKKAAAPKKKANTRISDTSWHGLFIEKLAETRSVTNACQAAGVSRRCAYKHRKKYKGFEENWAEAKRTNVDDLVASALKRAIDGHLEPVFYQGIEVGHTRKYETALTIFMLKALRPDRFNLDRDASPLTGDNAAAAIRGAIQAMEGSVPQ